jgi:preprotein translocase SecE subunit
VSKKQDKTNVTRITAGDALTPTPSKKKPVKATKKTPSNKESVTPKRKRSLGFLGSIGGYFKGAWRELRQVHWPTRQATWGLTGAVLLFSAFFVVFITLLDAGFKYAFEQILR